MELKIPAPPITYLFYVSSFYYQHFCNCNIIILNLFLSINFCLSNSSQTDTNSFLTPVFSASLLAISISSLSTSAIGSDGKMMVRRAAVKPFPVYNSFSSQIGFNMCLHFQLLLAFGLFHFRRCFSLRRLLNALFQHNYHNPHW